MTTIRTGRKLGRTLYQQTGPEPSDTDTLIGLMDTAELASEVAEAVSMARAGRGAGVSEHADVIREALGTSQAYKPESKQARALVALDALEAERTQIETEYDQAIFARNEAWEALARKDEALMELLAWLGQGIASRDDEAARKIARDALAGKGQA